MNGEGAETGVTLLNERLSRPDSVDLPPAIDIRQDWLVQSPSHFVEMVTLIALLVLGVCLAAAALF